MSPIETQRTAERDALLARLHASLEADPRIAAAWLWGSLGRGEADAWSDLDLWIVVYDDAYDPSIRREFAGGAVFTEEAPQNGPAGGAYLMSAHDAPSGPHLVDWYFQPLRFAAPDEGRVVLFARATLPATPEAATPNPKFAGTPEENAANKAALFWAMTLIQAKSIARKPVEDGMGFEGMLLSLLGEVAAWRGRGLKETETPGLRLAAEKLDRLRSLGATMAEVAPEFSSPLGPVERYLESVREVSP